MNYAALVKFGFALVLPEEISRGYGFSAVECCGRSLSNGIDDLGNLRQIAQQVAELHPAVSDTAIFGSGWSNGGFLVSADALVSSQSGSSRLFKAIAPISGFQYEVPSSGGVLPVFMFHSEDDPIVRFEGCCMGPRYMRANNCCCGIGRERGTCVGTRAILQKYADLNNCRSSNTSNGVVVSYRGGFRCESRVECEANTTLCQHPGGLGHFNGGMGGFRRFFPTEALQEIGKFFAREACNLGSGHWHEGNSECKCPRGYVGRYCLGTT